MFRTKTIRSHRDPEVRDMMRACNEIEHGLRSFKAYIKFRLQRQKLLKTKAIDWHQTGIGEAARQMPGGETLFSTAGEK